VFTIKQLLEFIVKALVDDPEKVQINEIDGETYTKLEIRVASDDMGKVIGKQGKIAKAIRTVVKAAAVKENKKVVVEIV
jgi:predicted RNA-binding protein YlqC (UPF0109 family)